MAEDGLKALTEFWSAQGKAMLDAQQSMMRSILGVPEQPDLARATDALAALWTAATQLSTEMAQRLPQGIADPRQWMAGTGLMDGALAGMADAPRLADLFDVERRSAGVMRRWTELRQRSLEHQQVVLQVWMQAAQSYSTALAGRSGGLEPKQAMALWAEIGNRLMLEAQRSEAFLSSQRAMIRASTELHLAQSELSEHIGKQFGLPTRSEVDDLHRSMTEMRRELRRTRRELETVKDTKAPVMVAPLSRGKSSGRKGR